MQQVNLFQASYRWEEDALPSEQILKIVGTAAALALLLYGVAWLRSSGFTGELGAQLEHMRQLNSQMIDSSERVASRVEDRTLSGRVAELRERLNAKKRLLSALSGRGEGNSEGFSSYLAGLAHRKVDGVWLRSIHLGKGGDSLKVVGSALAPEGVAELLDQLGNERSFDGRQFRTFKMKTSDERLGAIDFVIATEAENPS
ncbi:MAG: PilN domain-containing protein [bacterium]|nr:PilN domain-containing protein [bacterium]